MEFFFKSLILDKIFALGECSHRTRYHFHIDSIEFSFMCIYNYI